MTIPENLVSDDDDACTCTYYVVDYSDPERYHPENIDREADPNCPVHKKEKRNGKL